MQGLRRRSIPTRTAGHGSTRTQAGIGVALTHGNAALGRHPGRSTRTPKAPYTTDGRLTKASRHACTQRAQRVLSAVPQRPKTQRPQTVSAVPQRPQRGQATGQGCARPQALCLCTTAPFDCREEALRISRVAHPREAGYTAGLSGQLNNRNVEAAFLPNGVLPLYENRTLVGPPDDPGRSMAGLLRRQETHAA